MTRAKATVRVKLAVLALALISGGTQAAVVLLGTPAGRPSQVVEFSLAATPGTLLNSIDIVPRYDRLSAILTLLSFEEAPGLTDGASGMCLEGACAFTYIPPKSFGSLTELATWQFIVNVDAENFVDKNREFKQFDFGVTVGTTRVRLPEDRTFRVLAVPEPSVWALVAVGLILILAADARTSRSGADTQRRTV